MKVSVIIKGLKYLSTYFRPFLIPFFEVSIYKFSAETHKKPACKEQISIYSSKQGTPVEALLYTVSTGNVTEIKVTCISTLPSV